MSTSMSHVNLYSELSSETSNALTHTYKRTQTLLITNQKCTHAQSNYTNRKLNTWLKHLVPHPAKTIVGLFYIPEPTQSLVVCQHM